MNWTEQSSHYIGPVVEGAVQRADYGTFGQKLGTELSKEVNTIIPVSVGIGGAGVITGVVVSSDPLKNTLEDVNAAAGRAVAPNNQTNKEDKK